VMMSRWRPGCSAAAAHTAGAPVAAARRAPGWLVPPRRARKHPAAQSGNAHMGCWSGLRMLLAGFNTRDG
jgi:hypothetical protein